MKTDRELLEAAAKAAGLTVGDWIPGVGMMRYDGGTAGNYSKHRWDPLQDDGDALRLAVKLRIDFCITTNESMACAWCAAIQDFIDEPLAPDERAATRRAIVRAAAAMVAV